MATGLDLPVRVDATGRTVRAFGDTQAQKIIMLALGDDENENAFQQDVSLGTGQVFSISDPTFRARTLSKLHRIFARFQQRKKFSLVQGSVKWTKGKPGETVLEFDYINLETDEREHFARKFT